MLPEPDAIADEPDPVVPDEDELPEPAPAADTDSTGEGDEPVTEPEPPAELSDSGSTAADLDEPAAVAPVDEPSPTDDDQPDVDAAPVETDSASIPDADDRTSHPGERRRDQEPELPDDVNFSDLDPEARRELKSLSKSVAELVGRHLVAAGLLIDEDPDLALAHARFARTRASRVAVVREAAGIAAYHAGEWAEALGEFRAVRRMTGVQTHLPVMVDCERALGRPERALELAAEAKELSPDVAVELKIVAAGARRDLGQIDAAVVALQGPDLDPQRRDPWSARLFYAYADNLEAAGRTDDAIRWFLNAADADAEEETDAAERATALSAS
jgi:hypothetical protein